MRVIPKDKVIFHFNPTNPANYTVEDGETFWVECDDCYSGQITDESVKRPDIDIGIMDCAVGPIAISGAHPGDTLCVEVMAIDLAPQGVMVTSVGLGVLGDHITEPNTKIIPVHDGFAHFSDDIKLPLTPMIGVMGVATKSGEIHCAVPEDHGANMDTKLICVGSRVYFPVNAEGAGLAVGDMPAWATASSPARASRSRGVCACASRSTTTVPLSALSSRRQTACTFLPPGPRWTRASSSAPRIR